jgi:hypothetical protein
MIQEIRQRLSHDIDSYKLGDELRAMTQSLYICAVRLKALWKEQHGGTLRIISLFDYQGFTPELGDSLMCPLEECFQHHERKNCPTCTSPNPSSIIPIDSHTYLLEIGGATTPCRIRAEDAFEAKTFFTRYSGAGAVQLHRDDDRGRHHMVYVDIAPLLEHAVFRERLTERVNVIKDKRCIQHVISPRHQNAVAPAKLVTTDLGLTVDALVVADERDADALSALSRERHTRSHFLIVDDVLVFGHRIRGYKNALHSCGFNFGGNELSFLILRLWPPYLRT